MSLQRIQLRRLADARSGDKGSSANIGIIAHTVQSFELLKTHLTAESVQKYFHGFSVEKVDRYELPNLLALNFVLHGILEGGGSRSLRIDAQGKALGQILLDMPLDIPAEDLVGEGGKPSVAEPLVALQRPHKHVAVLTMQRPEKHNALNIALLQQLCSRLEELSWSPIRALILAAEGASFCAGMDLKDAVDEERVEASAALLAKAFTLLLNAPFVVIAAAQGAAIGGGAGLLSACDMVVAASDLRISYPELRKGLVPAQVAPLLMRVAPRHVVRELLLAGEPFDAGRALAAGLINKIVAPAYLFSEALGLAEHVIKSAPESIRQTKALMLDLEQRTLQEEQRISMPYHMEARRSAAAAEGIQAFLEKRPPEWMRDQGD